MPIPALIVSGWLGSGKTTLVGHLLDEARARGIRLAIISNEFGDTGIDRALLDSGEDGYVELDGGCVCCRLSDALGDTLVEVVRRANPDRIVLETSGLALPGEIVLTFWRPPVDRLVSDETVAVLVDGERLLQGFTDEPFMDQIESADLIVLNKCDLLTAEQADAAEAKLRELTLGQPVFRAVNARLGMDLLFPPDADGARAARRDATATPEAHSHDRYDSFVLDFPGEVDPADVLARIRAEDAVRAKGFVRTRDGVRVVQGVGARIEVSEPRVPVADALVGRVVVIRRAEGRDAH